MEIDAYLSERQKGKKKKRAYLRIVAACVIVYVVLVGIFWFILRSPFFAVSKVVIKGNAEVPSDAVLALLQSAALRDHNWWKALMGFRNMMTWPNALSDRDLVFIPQIASVSIDKSYFSHIVTATVTERHPFAIWCFMPKLNGAAEPVGDIACYSFDKDGVLFEKTFDTQGSLVYAVHDYSEKNPGLGSTVLAPRLVPNLISIVNAIRATGLDAQEIAIRDISLQEVQVVTYGGPTVYFSLRFPADNDVQFLKSLMAKQGFANLQYVDLRVENRAYYK